MLLMDLFETFKRIILHVNYVMIYYILGGRAILQDMMNKKYNRLELKTKTNYVAIVTGGARGIGSGVVKKLLECDMHVVIACREVQKGRELVETIRQSGITSGKATVHELELTSLQSVRKFADFFLSRFQYLNILVNNAGIMFAPYEETEEGFESQFGVNYLSHFLLTQLLIPALEAAGRKFEDNPKIVNVSSCAHEVAPRIDFDDINMRKKGFITHAAYATSKLCQLMSTKSLNRKFKEKGSKIQVFAVHPGVVDTELFEGTLLKLVAPWVLTYFSKTPDEAATTVTYCCITEDMENAGGSYVSNCRIIEPSTYANSVKTQETLYDFSMRMIEPFLNGNQNVTLPVTS